MNDNKMTDDEIEKMIEETDKIHKIWYDFMDYMKEYFFDLNTREYKEDKDGNIVWEEVEPYKTFDITKMVGYDAMLVVEEYVETHPDVVLVRCDDSYFTGSLLVLIPHPEMGITVIYIPQNGKDNEFFLYPYHIKMLQNAIAEMTEQHNIRSRYDL